MAKKPTLHIWAQSFANGSQTWSLLHKPLGKHWNIAYFRFCRCTATCEQKGGAPASAQLSKQQKRASRRNDTPRLAWLLASFLHILHWLGEGHSNNNNNNHQQPTTNNQQPTTNNNNNNKTRQTFNRNLRATLSNIGRRRNATAAMLFTPQHRALFMKVHFAFASLTWKCPSIGNCEGFFLGLCERTQIAFRISLATLFRWPNFAAHAVLQLPSKRTFGEIR